MTVRSSYGVAIREGFAYLLRNHSEVCVLGQGLWSPWYVGSSMTDLDVEFGRERLLDSPVSEQATTGAAIGAALAGARPIVVHPRMDFMLLAVDQVVTQAAKWSSMFGQAGSVPVVIRAIINRGGQQGAQHSQALHAWFAHVPGLRVVMPYSVADARDLLVAATLCDDPVLYVDDRWLYELEDDIPDQPDLTALQRGPVVRRRGDDVTLVGAGHSVAVALEAADRAAEMGIESEVIDLRILNPLDCTAVVESVRKTGRIIAIDGGWTTCGLAGEILARVVESLEPKALRGRPRRVTLQDVPAPTSGPLEDAYYPTADRVIEAMEGWVGAVAAVDGSD